MLRPEQMSRVSVTGSKPVMDDVIEAVHDLRLLHVTEYDDSWGGFDPGDPVEGADEAAEKLVTVRSLQSILGVEAEDAGQPQLVTDDALDDELEDIRQEVNELDDRREELRNELRSVEDRIDTMAPFVDLGIDLDLLGGYDTLSVAVGEGNPDDVRDALADSDLDEYEVFAEDDVVAVFARTDESTLQDVLVGTSFTELAVPDGDGDPETYLADLRERERELDSKLTTVESQLSEKRIEVGSFLLSAEEKLAIEVQKREAPLTFATTENAFVAEGWIPTEEFDTFTRALTDAVGESVDVEELERARYDEHGHAEAPEPIPEVGSDVDFEADGEEAERAADEEAEPQEAAADGGVITMGDEDPPVVQDNPGPVKPFEALVEIINRPKYSEFDPTVVLFLTFPLFFGFMIGDLGYGVLYMGLGYWLIKNFDSDVLQALGGIGLWAGGFTAVFGILYGEIFGLHVLGEVVWGTSEHAGVVGQLFGMHGPPIHKGLQPHYIIFAKAWLMVSVITGVLHLVLGRVFDFVHNYEHGFKAAMLESGSWIILTVGMWYWVFTRTVLGPKPEFIFTAFAAEGMQLAGEPIPAEEVAIPLGFNGFAPIPLVGGLSLQVLIVLVGLVMVIGEEGGIGLVESITQGFGHVVSYTRLAAVLLAKAGMALVVNLLVFGASLSEGEFHFIYFMEHAPDPEHVVFAGLVNGDGAVALVGGWIVGILILLLGHLLVLVLGITSAGLQAVRLEYVEFFGKFYEGGGKAYNPFGYERSFTTED